MMPFECYKTYLAIKNHFTKEKFDYQKFGNKLSKITLKSFYKRKDRFYFESMVRKYPDKDIENFFVSNFIAGSDPQLVYMATIVKTGEQTYRDWQKRIQSLSYVFKNEALQLFEDRKVDDVLFFLHSTFYPSRKDVPSFANLSTKEVIRTSYELEQKDVA